MEPAEEVSRLAWAVSDERRKQEKLQRQHQRRDVAILSYYDYSLTSEQRNCEMREF